jgi:GH24 family phage-related lysozyme (muramidase)
MNKKLTVLMLAALCLPLPAQQGDGLVTNFTGPEEAPLVTRGDYVLRGTVLVQYQGGAAEVVIPADWGITEIADEAFQQAGIQTLVIPQGVAEIGPRSFWDCYNLRSLSLPQSLSHIGDGAFAECPALVEIIVDKDNPHYADQGGALFSRDFSSLLRYPAGKREAAYAVPPGVTAIGKGAFRRSGQLVSIELPDSVVSIGEEAFAECRSLASVRLGKGVTRIGDAAFNGCWRLASLEIPRSVTVIGDFIFSGCGELASIYVEEESRDYAQREGVLFNKTFTTLIRYPPGKGESSYQIPPGVTHIGNGAFAGSKLSSIDIPNSVRAIGNSAFSFCNGLSSVDIPNSVVAIGNSAFFDCDILARVNLGSSVTRIGNFAFAHCFDLESINFPNGLVVIGDSAFNGCTSLVSANLPASLATIGENAFFDCDRLAAVSLGSGVIHIGEGAFSGCKRLAAINVDRDNRRYAQENGVLFNKDWTLLINYPAGKGGQNYSPPAGLRAIGRSAFKDADYLVSITLPDSVADIGERAFYYCAGLARVNLGSGVTRIGEDAFSGCGRLTAITLPALNPPAITSLWERHTPNQPHPTISIPRSARSAYLGEAGWRIYAGSLRPIEG